MSGIDPKQIARFVIILAVIALLINSLQIRREQQKAAAFAQQQLEMANEAASRKAVQAAATAHAEYLARYVNNGFARKQGIKTAAVAVASEDGRLNRTVTSALENRFQREPVQILSPFFKPEFVSDGLFNDALTGSSELFQKLDLANSVDALVLAQQNVQYAQNTALENVITATMQLKVAVMPVSGRSDGKTWTFTASGPGFTKEVARQAAEERLIKQIAADTNMSLTLQNH